MFNIFPSLLFSWLDSTEQKPKNGRKRELQAKFFSCSLKSKKGVLMLIEEKIPHVCLLFNILWYPSPQAILWRWRRKLQQPQWILESKLWGRKTSSSRGWHKFHAYFFLSFSYLALNVGTVVRSKQQKGITKSPTLWLEDQNGEAQVTKKYWGDCKDREAQKAIP